MLKDSALEMDNSGIEREYAKNVYTVAPGVWRIKDVFVNVFLVENSSGSGWVLIDAGLKSTGKKIKETARELFGGSSRPSAIIMTHGHFDHVGSLKELAGEWNVPVYAHSMELPYLTGRAAYPPPDPGVGGGLLASLSFLFPETSANVSGKVRELAGDGTIPELPGWVWIYTPGHAPGHISLFRESDKVLIAGDAVVSTKQESAISVMFQKRQLSGPPKYFTPDWNSAAESVKKISKLNPEVVATGHGKTLYGIEVQKALLRLSRQFWHLGMPKNGRYVREPATFNEDGPTYVPPKQKDYTWLRIAGATAMVVVGYILYKKQQKGLARTLMAGSITMLTAPMPEI